MVSAAWRSSVLILASVKSVVLVLRVAFLSNPSISAILLPVAFCVNPCTIANAR